MVRCSLSHRFGWKKIPPLNTVHPLKKVNSLFFCLFYRLLGCLFLGLFFSFFCPLFDSLLLHRLGAADEIMFFHTSAIINYEAKSTEATFIGLSFFDLSPFFWLGLSFSGFFCFLLSCFFCFFFCGLFYRHSLPPIPSGCPFSDIFTIN